MGQNCDSAICDDNALNLSPPEKMRVSSTGYNRKQNVRRSKQEMCAIVREMQSSESDTEGMESCELAFLFAFQKQ